jgi:hypothetical protein
MSGVTLGGQHFPSTHRLPHLFGFSAVMAAVVADRRGGKATDHIRECFEFMRDEVLRLPVGPTGPLPADYDWTIAGAVDSANAMLEYDA